MRSIFKTHLPSYGPYEELPVWLAQALWILLLLGHMPCWSLASLTVCVLFPKEQHEGWVWVSCSFQVLASLRQNCICSPMTFPMTRTDACTGSSIFQTQFCANAARAHNNQQLRNRGTPKLSHCHTADQWWGQNKKLELSQPTLRFHGQETDTSSVRRGRGDLKEHAFLKLPFPTQHLSHHVWWRASLNPCMP